MRHRVLALALAIVACGVALPTSAHASELPEIRTTEDAFARIRLFHPVPAVAGMLVRDGRVVDEVAVGVRKAGDPTRVRIDDPFHLGSDTKAMTATLVAMLVDRGELSWTSTLGELFPGIASMDPAYRDVTVEMLLAHRAGLGSESTFDDGRLFASLRAPGLDAVDGRRLVARAMLSSPPLHVPGSTFAYSNAGYLIVGAIIEEKTGKRWEAVMRDELFAPLGMTRCGFGALGNPRSPVAGVPWGHRASDGGWQAVVLDNPETLGPAATVHCPMAEWMAFVTLHLDAFNGRPRLVSAAGFAKLHGAWPDQAYTPGGWLRTEGPGTDGPVFSHEGSNTLNYAIAWWAPAQRAAIVTVANAGIPGGRNAARLGLLTLQRKADAR